MHYSTALLSAEIDPIEYISFDMAVLKRKRKKKQKRAKAELKLLVWTELDWPVMLLRLSAQNRTYPLLSKLT